MWHLSLLFLLSLKFPFFMSSSSFPVAVLHFLSPPSFGMKKMLLYICWTKERGTLRDHIYDVVKEGIGVQ